MSTDAIPKIWSCQRITFIQVIARISIRILCLCLGSPLICWLVDHFHIALCANISISCKMCKYFTLRETVQIFHSAGNRANISLCGKPCKYFSQRENLEIFHSAGKYANFSISGKMCKYFTLQENVQIFHSVGKCANISLSRKMCKYFNPQVWFSCSVKIYTEDVLCSLKSDLLRAQPCWLVLYQGRTENGWLVLVFDTFATHFQPCSWHHWSRCWAQNGSTRGSVFISLILVNRTRKKWKFASCLLLLLFLLGPNS